MITPLRRFVGLLGFFGILCSHMAVVAQSMGTIPFSEIGDQIIASHGVVEKAKAGVQDKDEQIKLEVQPLSLSERQKIAFSLVSEAEAAQQPQKGNSRQALKILLNDLELFYTHDQQNHGNTLFSRIDNTVTVFGQAELAKMVAHPIDDIEILQARQELVKKLVEDEALFNEIQKLLERVKQAENGVCSYWESQNKATHDMIESHYFGSWLGGLNKNPYGMELGVRLGNLDTAYHLVGKDLIGICAVYPIAKSFPLMREVYQGLYNLKEIAFLPLTWALIKGQCWPFGYLSRAYSLDPEDQIIKLTRGNTALAKTFLVGLATATTASLAARAYFSKPVIDQAKLVNSTNNYLQERLMAVAKLVNTTHAIHQLGNQHSSIAQCLPSFAETKKLFTSLSSSSSELAQLLRLLKTSTFKGNPSFFSLTGRVLAAHKLMEASKQKLVVFMQFVGELDAYMSIAKLYKKFASERVKYSFVEYKTGNKPYIKFDNFWNPVVDPAKVVANNLELGAAGKERNMVVTGANTGGKSTLLKAIMTNMLFAQTIGIVPSEFAIITPCAFLATSLNVVDNTAAGDSLFQAEVNRAKMLMHAAAQMKAANKPCFIIMDEMFRGTRPEKADQLTYDCGLRLVDCPTTIFILATHYLNKPLQLEKQTKGAVKNYKVDAYIAPDGKIVRPFKLEVGVTKNNIASEILNKEMDSFGADDKDINFGS